MTSEQNFTRRNRLLDIQKEVQQQWKENKSFKIDANQPGKEKFFVTFPFPYMNGVLHLGHAFSLSKAEFSARYQRLRGKEVLFPFGFHCTGMPIAACADKLKREFEFVIENFGNPPVFPEEDEDKDDNTNEPNQKRKKKAAGKKSKKKYQWEILREMCVSEEDIPKFRDAKFWLEYFPPIAQQDLQDLGAHIDFRRSFITTNLNPYFDAFVKWHFSRVKDKIAFGKRPCVFSPKDNQPCADHDRASGEGVQVMDYICIKLEMQQPYPQILTELIGTKKVVLPAATLRPETMYGQTNCWILPDGEYNIYDFEDEVLICSSRSAYNMSYQDVCERGKLNKVGVLFGTELLGCTVKAPLCQYDKIHILPLLTIDMDKGTGVVTSVPSDSPDDYQALKDLRIKPKFREKYNLSEDMIYDVVPIINIPEFGNQIAADLCEKRKVQSQNDKEKLQEIKKECYLQGFNNGIMTVGKHKDKKVCDIKQIVWDELIANNEAFAYFEPESLVMSRSGDECVVALEEQWYFIYGEEKWKGTVSDYIDNSLNTYSSATKKKFQDSVGWLKNWACSRTYGLGTTLPWDEKFLIESLSDSTIYMAYYTIAHCLQGGALDGSVTGPSGITPDQLNNEVFDYIFLNKDYPKDCKISIQIIDYMKNEFEYWYPVDLRVSAKDLIGNHLTMCLYNHEAVWGEEMMPKSFYTNGHLMINGEKMSKQTGNFLTLKGAIEQYSADAIRFSLADAGDTLEDANFVESTANSAVLKLTREEDWINEILKDESNLRTDSMNFIDSVFMNEIGVCINNATDSYESMQYRDALKYSYFEMCNARDNYRLACDVMHKDIIKIWIKLMLVMLSPICPHFTQHMWSIIGEKEMIIDAQWPNKKDIDDIVLKKIAYIRDVNKNFRISFDKHNSKVKVTNAIVYINKSFPEFQVKTVEALKDVYIKTGKLPTNKDVAKILMNSEYFRNNKKQFKNAMQFAIFTIDEVTKKGNKAFDISLEFDEFNMINQYKDMITRGVGDIKVYIKCCDDVNDDIKGEFNEKQNEMKKTISIPGSPSFFFF